jgi:bleomycin hydrolase
MKPTILLVVTVVLTGIFRAAIAQTPQQDRAVFVQPKNEFLDEIRKESERFRKTEAPAKRELKMDFSTIHPPSSPADFTRAWHFPPVSQGISGMCWCFSATSFYESEIHRLTGREVKLSELYTVYWESVEKAKEFIRTRGQSAFGQGSEANAVPRIWKKYGIVPATVYTGLLPGQKFHDHDLMFAEMQKYLTSLKSMNAWNEDVAVSTIQAILNHYLGEPPRTFLVDGKSMTPKDYLEKVVRLNLDDYVEIMSLMEQPYYQLVEYAVPDNWWHNRDYCNVPLDEFMDVVRKAVRKGYTLALGGDTSEPGYEGHAGIGVVPTFDIPPDRIDESARQFRFSNGTTTDDHGIHLVGYCEKEGKDWYLIKDSGSGSRNNSHPGYYFYREDYVRLKIMGFMVHKDVVQDLLSKFQRP